ISLSQQDRILLQNDLEFRDSASSVTFVSSKFQLNKWRSNLEFDLSSHVDNSWLEMEAFLVDDATGTELSTDELFEFYHGYEDGESWSEGDPVGRAYISSVPAGR